MVDDGWCGILPLMDQMLVRAFWNIQGLFKGWYLQAPALSQAWNRHDLLALVPCYNLWFMQELFPQLADHHAFMQSLQLMH
jgi:hypothetical protein